MPPSPGPSSGSDGSSSDGDSDESMCLQSHTISSSSEAASSSDEGSDYVPSEADTDEEEDFAAPAWLAPEMLERRQASLARATRLQRQMQCTRRGELQRALEEGRVERPAAAMAKLGVQYAGGKNPCASITIGAQCLLVCRLPGHLSPPTTAVLLLLSTRAFTPLLLATAHAGTTLPMLALDADLRPDTLQHLEALARHADEHGDPLIPCASNVQEDWGLHKLFAGGYCPAQLSYQPASGARRACCQRAYLRALKRLYLHALKTDCLCLRRLWVCPI